MERREFLKRLSLLAGGSLVLGRALGQTSLAAEITPAAGDSTSGQVPRRKLGRHDLQVSCLAIGGHTLATTSDEQESFRIVDAAIDAGVNFFDNAWDYHNGRAEELLGRALARDGGKRDKVFLMTKVCTHGKGRDVAMRMLEESLHRLQTDHLDLWQVHAVATQAQVESAYVPGGVIEALEEAKKQGKVRFVGFTGHTDPDVHLAMLSHGYAFDTCQFPLSAIEVHSDAFQRRVLPEVLKQKIAPLAMKTMLGNAQPIRDGVMKAHEALRYALSLPVAAVVSGINSMQQLRENVAVASAFTPMSPEEMVALETRVRPAWESHKYEAYRKWLS